MIKEAGRLLIQCYNGANISGIKLKIEDVHVLGHPLFSYGFGDRYNPALGQPAENDLSHGFAVLGGHGFKYLILKNIVLAFRERSPRFDLNAVFLKQFLRLDLLMERVRFNLINGRSDFIMETLSYYKPNDGPAYFEDQVAKQILRGGRVINVEPQGMPETEDGPIGGGNIGSTGGELLREQEETELGETLR